MPRHSLGALVAAVACLCGAAGAWAAFAQTSSNGSNVVTAQRIFATTETTSAWSVNDQADGTAANVSDQGAVAGDGRFFDSGAYGNAFSATRYSETEYASPLPPAISVSGASFNFNFRPNTSTDTACFYFETRRSSTGVLIQAHGDAANTIQCATGSSFTTTSTPLPEINTTDLANDVTIRVYVRNTGSRPITTDLGTVTGTASNGFGSFTLNDVNYLDRATGTAANFPYGPAITDATYFTSTAWATAFNASRFLEFTFPSTFVPSGATITAVTFKNTFRSSVNNRIACVYYEFYSGATQVATRASSGTPSCASTSGVYQADSYSLTEVDTAAEVNGLKAKIYGRDSGSNPSRHDLLTLTVSYSLD